MSDIWDGFYTREWQGNGYVVDPNSQEHKCRFWIGQLLNGKLFVQISDFDESFARERWVHQRDTTPLTLQGKVSTGETIQIEALRLIIPSLEIPTEYEGYIEPWGYVEIGSDGYTPDALYTTATVHLSNFVTTQYIQLIHLEGAEIQFAEDTEFKEYRRKIKRLRTTDIAGVVTIRFKTPQSSNYIDTYVEQLCSLLRLTQRSFVAPVAQTWTETQGKYTLQKYTQPIFSYPPYPRPLITPKNLGRFLTTTFATYPVHAQKWNLGQAIDHYMQAIVLKSIWTQALGFFTALETIKQTFLTQDLERQEKQRTEQEREQNGELKAGHIFGTRKFKRVSTAVEEFVETISDLTAKEKKAIKPKISELNRYTYDRSLQKLFKHLGMGRVEVQTLIKVRNALIHEGIPTQEFATDDVVMSVYQVASLVERIILKILEYDGPVELYDEGNQIRPIPYFLI